MSGLPNLWAITRLPCEGINTRLVRGAHRLLAGPTGPAEWSAGVHTRKCALFVFDLTVDQNGADSLRKFCGLGVGSSVDDGDGIEYGNVRKIADLKLAAANKMMALCWHGSDFSKCFGQGH